MSKRFTLIISAALLAACQPKADVDQVPVPADTTTYTNPILHADYSDPDAIRVGDDFYMVSSSFNSAPGLPILHSRDLVNWQLIGHVFQQQVPTDVFARPQHGKGAWAPCFRYHDGKFWVFYPDPDFGIYVTTADDPAGPWSEPKLILAGKGIIDPAPLWDDDGQAYLAHAWAASRAGFNNVITLHKMSADGTEVLGEGKVIIDGGDYPLHHTVEGPKFYKRNGYYYVFAPAGGVEMGWQTVFRARDIEGPYEHRVVLAQGNTPINGPHQGAWVTTPGGEDWYLHFQYKEAYGRIVHLQPMQWRDDWPVIGLDEDGDGKGEPVLSYRKPEVARPSPDFRIAAGDEFGSVKLGPQWQWNANWQADWYSLGDREGWLRLAAQPLPADAKVPNLWEMPSLLLQKFPDREFQVTTKLQLGGEQPVDAGLLIYGYDYAWLGLRSGDDGYQLVHEACPGAMTGCVLRETVVANLEEPVIEIRATVRDEGRVLFAYRAGGETFTDFNEGFLAKPGRWVGAHFGIFARSGSPTGGGYADFDYVRVAEGAQ